MLGPEVLKLKQINNNNMLLDINQLQLAWCSNPVASTEPVIITN